MKYFGMIGLGVFLVAAAMVMWRVFTLNLKRRGCREVRCLCFDDKAQKLDKTLKPLGLRYQRRGDLLVSSMNSWQRQLGYCCKYEKVMPKLKILADCQKVYFDYGGLRWLLLMRKGQYGLATGGELGLYVNRDVPRGENPEDLYYESALDEERIHMQFRLSKGGRIIMQHWSRHWWLAAFAVGEYSMPEELKMKITLRFFDSKMCEAFYKGLLAAGYKGAQLFVEQNNGIRFTFHREAEENEKINRHRQRIQHKNESHCKRYMHDTGCLTCTLDRLALIEYCCPHAFLAWIRVQKKYRYETLNQCRSQDMSSRDDISQSV